MKTVGVISDTHGRLDERAFAELADCDHIIHAGDIGDPAILRELEACRSGKITDEEIEAADQSNWPPGKIRLVSQAGPD